MRLVWVRPRSRFGPLQVYALIGLAALAVARSIPIARWLAPLWGCPFRRLTGVPCLACGLTRAFDYTTHGRILDAFRVTPLGALVPWACAAVGLWALVATLARAPVPDIQLTRWEGIAARLTIVGLVLINWIYMVARALPHRAALG